MSKNDRIKNLASIVGGLSGFAKCETEVMIMQTLTACVVNLAQRGEAVSFKGTNLSRVGHGGLVDNPTGLRVLVSQGWITIQPRPFFVNTPKGVERDMNGSPLVLVPTDKLLDALEVHLGDR